MISPSPLETVEHTVDGMVIQYMPRGCNECNCGPIRKVHIRAHRVGMEPRVESVPIAELVGPAAQSLWEMVMAWKASQATMKPRTVPWINVPGELRYTTNAVEHP